MGRIWIRIRVSGSVNKIYGPEILQHNPITLYTYTGSSTALKKKIFDVYRVPNSDTILKQTFVTQSLKANIFVTYM
jgi:hypothetical protein